VNELGGLAEFAKAEYRPIGWTLPAAGSDGGMLRSDTARLKDILESPGELRSPVGLKPSAGSPVTTCWKPRPKPLILSCLLTIPHVYFPAQWLLALETAQRADPR